MELSRRCSHAGCTQPGGRLSVFCDGHQEEQLKRAGLWRERRPPDPAADLVRYCEKIVRSWRDGHMEHDERTFQIFDLFVVYGRRHSPDCWTAALDSLPVDVLRDVLAFAREHPEPRVLPCGFPRPMTDSEKEQAVRVTQALLVERLDAHLGQP